MFKHMAIVKNNYVRRGRGERSRAKATIRYIAHRPGKDGAKITRTLFGRDGVMDRADAYLMIDEAEGGSIFFRFVISPDPQTEDTKRDIALREITEKTMLSLEECINKQVQWTAAVHADHAEHRHVHVVAVTPGRLSRQDFQALPGVMRQVATQACLAERRERDLTREQQERSREGGEWELER